ncbi:hypothetical protein O181_081247 [Austropuccinia psidii MF-1]|uniref:Uncharacterized protein n=1 Tax=Austropuccinia psidii MF-1 TaxID=1389203 RepID=A0A9Q3FQD5_9BASI|nr:hypothetical protein [Austropuccinia psidii MF-1]
MEIIGVLLAIEGMRGEICRRTFSTGNRNQQGRIYISSENAGALRKIENLSKPSVAQYLYLRAYRDLNALNKFIPVQLWWFPGNLGIKGNEKSNEEAKKPSLKPTNIKQEIKTSLSKIFQDIVKNNKYTPLTKEEQERIKFKMKPKLIIKTLNTIEKAQNSIINQFKSENT